MEVKIHEGIKGLPNGFKAGDVHTVDKILTGGAVVVTDDHGRECFLVDGEFSKVKEDAVQ